MSIIEYDLNINWANHKSDSKNDFRTNAIFLNE